MATASLVPILDTLPECTFPNAPVCMHNADQYKVCMYTTVGYVIVTYIVYSVLCSEWKDYSTDTQVI